MRAEVGSTHNDCVHDLVMAQVTFSEMLPGPEHLWLADTAGRRYTAEFRMVAVDTRDQRPAFAVRTL